jgi:hypothetical protein
VKHEARRVYDTVRRTGNTAGIHEQVNREKGMYRLIAGLARATDSTGILRALVRTIQSLAGAVMGLEKKRDLWRGIADYAVSGDTASRSLGIFSFVQTLLKAYDGVNHSNRWGRNISDNTAVSMENSNTARYIREL